MESAYSSCNVAEFKQGNNAMETVAKICSVYGEGTITDQAVRNWFVKFCSGDTSLKYEPRPGAHWILMLKL